MWNMEWERVYLVLFRHNEKNTKKKSVLGCLITAENFQKADMYPLAFQGALSWPEVVIQISTKRAPI